MRVIAVILLTGLTGCGYHLAGEKPVLPEDVRSLSIGTLANRSREHGLEKTLAFTFEREIHERNQFRLAEDPGAGDAVLSGTIRELSVRVVALDSNARAVQYEIRLVLDVTLTRQRDGRVLWHVTAFRETDEYSVSSSVVVTSSSEFQQGTLDAIDVRNSDPTGVTLSNIQLAGTERRSAIDRLLRQAAHDVYNQMVEDF